MTRVQLSAYAIACRVALRTMLLVAVLWASQVFVQSDVDNDSIEDLEEIRLLLRSTHALAQATNTLLGRGPAGPYNSNITWLQAFSIIVAADSVVERFEERRYGEAALQAVRTGAGLAVGSHLRSATFPLSFGYSGRQ